jgi:translocation and assembly module TamB
MTESPTPNPQNEAPEPRRRIPRVAIAIGAISIVGVGVGTGALWWFVYQQLVPLVTKELSKTLDRPIKIGKVEGFSLTGLKLGMSSLPPTDTDPDLATIEGVKVNFNPLEVFLRQRLGLDITLINPTIYLEQDREGTWLATQIKQKQKKGLIQVELNKIEFEKGTLFLASQFQRPQPETDTKPAETPKQPPEDFQPKSVALQRVKGSASFHDNNDRIQFDVTGFPEQEGRLRVQGEVAVPQKEVRLQVSAQNILLAEINPVLQQAPMDFNAGKVNGSVRVAATFQSDDIADTLPSLNPLEPLPPKLQNPPEKQLPQLEGNVKVEGLDLQIDRVPQPLLKVNGRIRFAQSAMLFEDTKGSYGLLPVEVKKGIIDLARGYELPIQVLPADTEKYLETLQLETPIDIAGEAEAIVKVVGPIDTPVLIGKANTTATTTIDRIPFSEASGQFALAAAEGEMVIEKIQAKPEAGGEIQGIVQIKLPTAEDKGGKTEGSKTSQSESSLQAGTDSDYKKSVANSPTQTQDTERQELLQKEDPKPEAIDPKTEDEKSQPDPEQTSPDRESNPSQKSNPNAKNDKSKQPPLTEPFIQAEFQAKEVPGDAIAQLYNVNIPAGISIGPVNARTRTVGPSSQLETLVQWEALAGTYPAKGDIEIAQSKIVFQNTLVQIDDAIVRGGGIVSGDRWEAAVALENTPITPFLPPDLPLDIGRITGRLKLAGSLTNLDPAAMQAAGFLSSTLSGGQVEIAGQLDRGQWEAEVTGNNLPLASLIPSPPPNLPLGNLSGRFQLRGSSLAFDPSAIAGRGLVSAGIAGGQVEGTVALAGGRWEADIDRFALPLSPFVPPETPLLPAGQVVGKGFAAGSLTNFDLSTLQANAIVGMTIPDGVAEAEVQVANGRWQANFNQFLIPLTPFLPPDTPGLQGAQAEGQGIVSGDLVNFDLANLTVDGVATLSAENLQASGAVRVANGRWNTNIDRFQASLSPFLPADTPLLSAGTVAGRGTAAGSLTNFDLNTLVANSDFALTVPDGGAAGTVTLENGRWDAQIDRLRLPLSPFVTLPDTIALSPLMNGNQPLRVSGSLNATTPQTLASSLTASGTVGVQINEGGAVVEATFDRGQWQARVQTEQFPLASLVPSDRIADLSNGLVALNLAGELDAAVNLSGNLTEFTPAAIAAALTPRAIVEGKLPNALRLHNLQINDAPLDRLIAGSIQVTPDEVILPLAGQDGTLVGERDRFAIVFDTGYVPKVVEAQFDVNALAAVEATRTPSESDKPRSIGITLEPQNYQVTAVGKRDGNTLDFTVANLPLSLFNLTSPPASPETAAEFPLPITGSFSGQLNWDLAKMTGTGNLELNQPTWGLLRADTLRSRFWYTGDSLVLDDTALLEGSSGYQLSGRIDRLTSADPQFRGQLQIDDGSLEHLVSALQVTNDWRQPSAAATPTNLPSVGLPDSPLLMQLRRFSEIQALLRQMQAARQAATPFPDISELKGLFDGEINVTGSVQTGADVRFDLAGGAWKWGEYDVNQVVAKGSFVDNIWEFQPLTLRANLGQEVETTLNFAGQVGGEQQSAQFELANLPMSLLDKFVDFPDNVNISGNLNASATLAGSFTNPQARGELTLIDGIFNRKPIEKGRGSFVYSDARLIGRSQIFLGGEEPITFRADLPLEFPGATTPPASEAFTINIDVKNDGLAVLNLLTDQVAWQGGEGQVDLAIAGERLVTGTGLNRSIAYVPQSTTGAIRVNNATFTSPNLPEPITGVTGIAKIDGERAIVEGIQGQFRQGQVIAQGAYPFLGFPLLPDDPQTPLTVILDGVALNLKGKYRGGVDGQLVIRGSQLSPLIGGELMLSKGQVLLPDQAAVPVDDGGATLAEVGPAYDKLKVTLAANTQILKPPVLNFLADGTLTIDGPIDDASAAGTIFLRRGIVNLFTTEFTLARDYKNTATFIPAQRLDPNLSVLMRASVQEASRQQFPTPTEHAAEIQETALDLGTLQTVRIEAKATGRASQIANNLELSSSPNRSETEIVALMGGGFVNTLGRGDSTLAIANLASSVLLTQFQSAINQALGLQDFRLFPTTTTRTSSLTLGAELGVNLTDRFSASILQVLDAEQGTRFNLRYRLNDNVLLRGSTDFSEDSRAEIEWNFRF